MSKLIPVDEDDELQLPEGTRIGDAFAFDYDEALTRRTYPDKDYSDMNWKGSDGIIEQFDPQERTVTVVFPIANQRNQTCRISLRTAEDLTFNAFVQAVRPPSEPVANIMRLRDRGR